MCGKSDVCLRVRMYEPCACVCVCARALACMMVSLFHLSNLVANSIMFHIFEIPEIRNL